MHLCRYYVITDIFMSMSVNLYYQNTSQDHRKAMYMHIDTIHEVSSNDMTGRTVQIHFLLLAFINEQM